MGNAKIDGVQVLVRRRGNLSRNGKKVTRCRSDSENVENRRFHDQRPNWPYTVEEEKVMPHADKDNRKDVRSSILMLMLPHQMSSLLLVSS